MELGSFNSFVLFQRSLHPTEQGRTKIIIGSFWIYIYVFNLNECILFNAVLTGGRCSIHIHLHTLYCTYIWYYTFSSYILVLYVGCSMIWDHFFGSRITIWLGGDWYQMSSLMCVECRITQTSNGALKHNWLLTFI